MVSARRHTSPGSKRVQVSFTSAQWDVLDGLRGELGNSDSDIVRNVVIAWLAEKSIIPHGNRKRAEVRP